MAAWIAMAESSGRQFATGAAGERGYWQIHWTPWTTFTSGAYRGRC